MIEQCNALKFITLLIFIQNILTFNLGVAFFKVREYILYWYIFSGMENPHQCLVCGNKFKSATSLRRHLKRHEMEVIIHNFVP